MAYLFHGKLCGVICPECPEALSHATVRFYRPQSGQDIPVLTTAQPKDNFALSDAGQVKKKSKELLAEAKTDENGQFQIEFGDKQDYAGGPVEIDVCLSTVPGHDQAKGAKPIQFTVAMLQPRWRETKEGFIAKWEYCLSARLWCYIRGLFGAWTICGRVVAGSNNAPVAGVRVHAFDVDWLQDDALGEAVTDSAGKFRIDYTTEDFHLTPFSPLINVEWTGGPDIYFRVETAGGTPIYSELPSRGRDPDRENRGPCFCVTLLLDENVDIPDPQTIPLFTHVGQYKVDSNPVNSGFLPDGTTKVGGFAFTGTIPLIGILPDGTAADPVEYRFRHAKHPALAPVNIADANIIQPTKIGQLQYFSWNGLLSIWEVKAADYWVNNPGAADVSIPQNVGPDLTVPVNKDIAADGWIRVPTDNQLYAGGIGRFVPGDHLAKFSTKKLTEESFDLTVTAPPLPLAAGDTVPVAQRSEAPKFRIFFEARKVAGATAISSNQLDDIAMSNTTYAYVRHPAWAGGLVSTTAVVSLDIAELIAPGATGCDRLNNDLHALFTVYHPYLDDAKVWFEGNAPLPAPHVPVVVGGEADQGLPGHHFDITGLAPCAYILWLRGTLNLTSGWGRISNATIWDRIAFCVG